MNPLSGSWGFRYSDDPDQKILPVTIENQENVIKIKIPSWGFRGMTIEIPDYDCKKKELKARYFEGNIPSLNDITFRVEQQGKLLSGEPEGIYGRSRRKWIILWLGETS